VTVGLKAKIGKLPTGAWPPVEAGLSRVLGWDRE
jgi:hypothetical protein